MSNEQEMREAFAYYWLKDVPEEYKAAKLEVFWDKDYMTSTKVLAWKAWQAATLAAEARIRELEAEVHNLNWALGTEGYDQMATPEEQAEHEEAVSRATANIDLLAKAKARHDALEADAKRYRWLRADDVGWQESDKRAYLLVDNWGKKLDELIDAALTEHKENQG